MKQVNIWGRVFNLILFVILITISICIIFPLIWMIISGFKSNTDFFMRPWSLPEEWIWENFVIAWENGVARYFLNSVLVTGVSVFLVLIISSLASYSLSRFDYKGKNILFIFIISGLMLAPQVSLIALFKMLQTLHLIDTYWALILPYVAFQIPFAVFLMRSYFLALPREIEDAAYIDGCNSWSVFWRIILPMSKPIVLTAGLLTGMFFWNEFMFALAFIESSELRTIPVGLMNLRSQLGTNYGVLLAGLFIATIPMILLFIIFQKHFINALSDGGVKG
ncbi:ABC transporter permease [Virgibacillus indicus]|uniref:ABC transporter permease n=1 Tax=Virgibacillus indicus TaxID=2024554 RepID=A0A265N697_9BACI|nr:carbohydrate ABC transporter permease [Virgibacillus indicus]OZU86984.1 ABC transporter permease [Virgibacillus indicus]